MDSVHQPGGGTDIVQRVGWPQHQQQMFAIGTYRIAQHRVRHGPGMLGGQARKNVLAQTQGVGPQPFQRGASGKKAVQIVAGGAYRCINLCVGCGDLQLGKRGLICKIRQQRHERLSIRHAHSPHPFGHIRRQIAHHGIGCTGKRILAAVALCGKINKQQARGRRNIQGFGHAAQLWRIIGKKGQAAGIWLHTRRQQGKNCPAHKHQAETQNPVCAHPAMETNDERLAHRPTAHRSPLHQARRRARARAG